MLFATETFAMGVNMPARTVVFNGLRKNDGHRFREVTAGEYIQMSGRAGRRGLDEFGTVVIAGETVAEGGLREVLVGAPTRLTSRFTTTYGMLLNLLRGDARQVNVTEMIERSFLQHRTQGATLRLHHMRDQLQAELAAQPPFAEALAEAAVSEAALDEYVAGAAELAARARGDLGVFRGPCGRAGRARRPICEHTGPTLPGGGPRRLPGTDKPCARG